MRRAGRAHHVPKLWGLGVRGLWWGGGSWAGLQPLGNVAVLAAPSLWRDPGRPLGRQTPAAAAAALFKTSSPGLLGSGCVLPVYVFGFEGPSPVRGRKVGAVSVAGGFCTKPYSCPFPSLPALSQLLVRQARPAMDLPVSSAGVRHKPPSEAGGGTLHRAVFREKLPETGPNCAHVWCASPCQGPTQPWEPARLWRFILQGFVSLIKRELCFLLREKPAVETAGLFLDSFYLSLRFLEGGVSLGMLVSLGRHPSSSCQRSCTISALAGGGRSILPKVISVFVYCGLATGSAYRGEYGQRRCSSPNRGTAAACAACCLLCLQGKNAARLRNM